MLLNCHTRSTCVRLEISAPSALFCGRVDRATADTRSRRHTGTQAHLRLRPRVVTAGLNCDIPDLWLCPGSAFVHFAGSRGSGALAQCTFALWKVCLNIAWTRINNVSKLDILQGYLCSNKPGNVTSFFNPPFA